MGYVHVLASSTSQQKADGNINSKGDKTSEGWVKPDLMRKEARINNTLDYQLQDKHLYSIIIPSVYAFIPDILKELEGS